MSTSPLLTLSRDTLWRTTARSSSTTRPRRRGVGGARMFNTRGGGGEGTASAVGDCSAAGAAVVPQGSGEGATGSGAASAAVFDLIQPHSVSAEEVAGFYGCTMGQARGRAGRREIRRKGVGKWELEHGSRRRAHDWCRACFVQQLDTTRTPFPRGFAPIVFRKKAPRHVLLPSSA